MSEIKYFIEPDSLDRCINCPIARKTYIVQIPFFKCMILEILKRTSETTFVLPTTNAARINFSQIPNDCPNRLNQRISITAVIE